MALTLWCGNYFISTFQIRKNKSSWPSSDSTNFWTEFLCLQVKLGSFLRIYERYNAKIRTLYHYIKRNAYNAHNKFFFKKIILEITNVIFFWALTVAILIVLCHVFIPLLWWNFFRVPNEIIVSFHFIFFCTRLHWLFQYLQYKIHTIKK